MCGIVGYSGKKDVKNILLDGLQELEYRGYDSAGIFVLEGEKVNSFKAVGKLVNLIEKAKDFSTSGLSAGIGHTRWATHGKPTELNAHPHLGQFSAVVHNGIIENYVELKNELLADGVTFLSQTDTEVIVHLFEKNVRHAQSSFEAFKMTIERLEGAYAILLITKDEKETIFFAKEGSPMILASEGKDEGVYFASSDTPLIGYASEAYYLQDGDYGYVTSSDTHIYDRTAHEIHPTFVPLPTSKLSAQKEGFRFFMEKEIYEQSHVISDTLLGRLGDKGITFDEIDESLFEGIREVTLCACGTSYHAALSASYLLERYARVKCSVEIASEFRYKEPLLLEDTLFVVISQSGETADTLEALKMAKEANLKTLAICNVDNSSMVRLADASILTRAGIEKGVASTKAFATQVTIFWMLALQIAQSKKVVSDEFIAEHLQLLKELPSVLKVESSLHERLTRLSKRYLHGHGFFFIGRDIFFPLALEGALKLKEISYLHAEGYPSGEMKHGPIALADAELFTIALMPENLLYDKIKSNVEELSARDSTICAISSTDFDKADDFVQTKKSRHYMHEFFEMMVVVQLLSMEISVRLGNDVDMPRNLAKSVTVE